MSLRRQRTAARLRAGAVRRLGRSLGVDLVPLKTCTYDCVYCQLGRTTRKTVRRQRWVDPSEVVAQVRARLESEPDVIALAGSGEPTLHAGIGDVIAGIKRLTDDPGGGHHERVAAQPPGGTPRSG